MKAFRVTGSFEDFRQPNGRQVFSIEFSAEDEISVREKALSTLGSKHRLARRQIAIDSVAEIPADEITNFVVRYDVTGE